MKESDEVILALEGLAESITKAKEDDIIDWKDLRHLAPLLVLAKNAINDAKNIPNEWKGASGEELEATATRLMAASVMLIDAVLR